MVYKTNKKIILHLANNDVYLDLIYFNDIRQKNYIRLEEKNKFIEFEFENGEDISILIESLKDLYLDVTGLDYEKDL